MAIRGIDFSRTLGYQCVPREDKLPVGLGSLRILLLRTRMSSRVGHVKYV